MFNLGKKKEDADTSGKTANPSGGGGGNKSRFTGQARAANRVDLGLNNPLGSAPAMSGGYEMPPAAMPTFEPTPDFPPQDFPPQDFPPQDFPPQEFPPAGMEGPGGFPPPESGEMPSYETPYEPAYDPNMAPPSPEAAAASSETFDTGVNLAAMNFGMPTPQAAEPVGTTELPTSFEQPSYEPPAPVAEDMLDTFSQPATNDFSGDFAGTFGDDTPAAPPPMDFGAPEQSYEEPTFEEPSFETPRFEMAAEPAVEIGSDFGLAEPAASDDFGFDMAAAPPAGDDSFGISADFGTEFTMAAPVDDFSVPAVTDDFGITSGSDDFGVSTDFSGDFGTGAAAPPPSSTEMGLTAPESTIEMPAIPQAAETAPPPSDALYTDSAPDFEYSPATTEWESPGSFAESAAPDSSYATASADIGVYEESTYDETAYESPDVEVSMETPVAYEATLPAAGTTEPTAAETGWSFDPDEEIEIALPEIPLGQETYPEEASGFVSEPPATDLTADGPALTFGDVEPWQEEDTANLSDDPFAFNLTEAMPELEQSAPVSIEPMFTHHGEDVDGAILHQASEAFYPHESTLGLDDMAAMVPEQTPIPEEADAFSTPLPEALVDRFEASSAETQDLLYQGDQAPAYAPNGSDMAYGLGSDESAYDFNTASETGVPYGMGVSDTTPYADIYPEPEAASDYALAEGDDDGNDLEVLDSWSLGPDCHLRLVEANGQYALMSTTGPEEDMQVEVLKIFDQHPTAHNPAFALSPEGEAAGQTLYKMQLGDWSAIISKDNSTQALTLHTEVSV